MGRNISVVLLSWLTLAIWAMAGWSAHDAYEDVSKSAFLCDCFFAGMFSAGGLFILAVAIHESEGQHA